jgi:RecA-family ATPase
MAAAPSNPYADQTVAPPAIDPSYIYEPTAQHSRAEQIFQGFLAKDELAVWIGHEKHRKTTLVLDFAVAAALGRDFLAFRFMPSTALRVVMFDYESKDDSIYRRSEAICNALPPTTAPACGRTFVSSNSAR